MRKSRLLMLLILLSISILLASNVAFAQAWWNENWKYRVPINVQELKGVNHDNYIVEFTFDTFTIGPIAQKPKVQAGCKDLRLVDRMNRKIDFDMERCNLKNTLIRFRTDIAANFNGTFAWLYYGNNDTTLSAVDVDVPYWTAKTSMPTARGIAPSAVVNKKIYVFGGLREGYSKAVEVYDPETNNWTTKKIMPFIRYAFRAEAIGASIYLMDGITSEFEHINSTQVYFPEAEPDYYEDRSDMLCKGPDFASAVIAGKIYTMGGMAPCASKTYEYDPGFDNWTKKADGLSPRYSHIAEAVGDKVYVIGGIWGETSSAKVEEYDPQDDVWSNCGNDCTSMPVGRYQAASAVVDGKIYVIGGTTNVGRWLKTNEFYDVLANTWTSAADMPTGRELLTAEAIDGRIYAIGGWTSTGPTKKVEEFTVPNWKLNINVGSEEFYIMPEVCDGIDNDQNGLVDDDLTDAPQYCENQLGVCVNATKSCGGTLGWLDCTPTDYLANNASYQINETSCDDELDNDCDGDIDMNDTDCVAPPPVNCTDADNDTFAIEGGECGLIDCDDAEPNINPNASEVCFGGIDENCNNLTDTEDLDCNVTGNITDQQFGLHEIGNGVCEPGENTENACIDCGCPGDEQCIAGVCTTPDPAALCGNDIKEAGEECDGTDDDACSGLCDDACFCPFIIGDGFCDKDFGEDYASSPEDCPKGMGGLLIGLAVVFIIIGLIGSYFFLFRPKMHLHSYTAMHGAAAPSADTSGAESFVNNALSQGYSPAQAKDALISRGWGEGATNSAIARAGTNLDQLHGLAEKHAVDVVHEDIDLVKDYIADCTKKGFTPTQIKTALKSSGWDDPTIEALLAQNTKVQGDLGKLAKKHGVEEPSEDVGKLKRFVGSSLRRGHTIDSVRDKLLDKKWPKDIIDKHIPKV